MAPLQNISLKEVLIASRKLINEGRLQAQQTHENNALSVCTNRYINKDGVEIRCVIGSVLNDEVLDRLEKDTMVSSSINVLSSYLNEEQLVSVTFGPELTAIVYNNPELAVLSKLQDQHDDAVKSPEQLPKFLEYFENLEKEHGTNNHNEKSTD